MPRSPEPLARLLDQINAGGAEQALPEIERILLRHPNHPGALALRAEALRLAGRVSEAVEAYRRAAEGGAGTRNWLVAGLLLASERQTDAALTCLRQALADSPDDEQVLDTLVTTLFNANRPREGIDYARRQLARGTNARFLANAALLLQSCDCYEESSNAFKLILERTPNEPALIGAALAAARFTCEWDWIESLQRQISAYYARGEYALPQEYPLTNLTWCADEACNLAVTRAYGERTVPKVQPCTPAPLPRSGRRIRVGYLSCDFRNHATMHLMAGLLESHDRARFEIFAYDYSAHDISDYRRRFLEAIEHHAEIHSMSDRQAAERIAQDRLDILFDLKVYTGGCRSAILAYRPAPLQASYLGFPGTAANAAIDFIVSDRFVTPDSSTPFYSERFCRLPHSYQCNDSKRAAAALAGTRAMHGLPDDRVVFGAFNQSYKIDRTSFAVWLRVLQAVPDSVLWLLGHNAAAIEQLARRAQQAGIAAGRVLFAPFANPSEHLARLPLADVVLDTLICNGHTTTSDALWAGVPVVTARGAHFASRVSESLLNAIDLPELVGVDHDDMVRIATRLGTDASYRAAVRAQVGANRSSSALFDTVRFARNFERAIELMIQQHSGERGHIDVPDCGAAAPIRAPLAAAAQASPPLQACYSACPLCGGGSVTLGFADAAGSAAWPAPLPRTIEWLRCPSCAHVHTRHYWTEAGRETLLQAAPAGAPLAGVGAATWQRPGAAWAPSVERVIALLGGYRALLARTSPALWVDVGCGDGALVMTAADYGFAAVGLDVRADSVQRLQALGFDAVQQDFMRLRFEVVPDVLSMSGVLEQMPDPCAALTKVARILRPGALLLLGTADLTSSAWRVLDAARRNPHWSQPERHHVFTRARLSALLQGVGLEVEQWAVPACGEAEIELYARRK